jgi:sugar phosphate permease
MKLKTGKTFYGWYTLGGVTLVTMVAGATFVTSFGVFLPVVSEECGWSRAEVSLALSLGMMSFGLPSPLYSILINKFGPRFSIILGNLLAALGMASFYFVQEIWQYYLLYIFIGAMSGFGGFLACTMIVNNWFVKKRSLAMGVVTASIGIGGLIFPPVVTALINPIGWQATWVVLAGIVALSVTIVGTALIRNKPEDMGQLPDGVPTAIDLDIKKTTSKDSGPAPAWRISNIFKGPTIWTILAFILANSITVGAMNAHQIAYLRDIDFTPMTAATTVSVMSIFSIVGSLGFGALALKINIRYLASAGLLFELISIIILLTTRNLTLIFVYSVLIGIGGGALVTAMPTFLGAYYPRERYVQILGLILPFHVMTQAASAVVVGVIHDTTNAYTTAFIIMGACALVGMMCAFLTRPPKKL